jgi:BirA family biotin operon repressor/biotin-[acetyl-CoA-carboxylase] ligase
MIQVKLNAIDSTNDYLKKNPGLDQLPNFLVVTAESQTDGRGQRGANWASEPGKNLITSILVHDFYQNKFTPFDLIIAVSVAIHEALLHMFIPNLAIKWPNDIMSGNKKIGGILIENIHKSDKKVQSIIGLGLNVNQINFAGFPQASSLQLICAKEFDTQQLLESIVSAIEYKLSNWDAQRESSKQVYQNALFKKGVISQFNTQSGSFSGTIMGVDPEGRLEISNECNQKMSFELKEIQLIY